MKYPYPLPDLHVCLRLTSRLHSFGQTATGGNSGVHWLMIYPPRTVAHEWNMSSSDTRLELQDRVSALPLAMNVNGNMQLASQ